MIKNYNPGIFSLPRNGIWMNILCILFTAALVNFQDVSEISFESADSLVAERKYELALEELHSIVKTCSNLNDSLNLSTSYHKIGRTHMRMNSDTLALEFLLKALRIREKLNEKKLIASTSFRVGVFHAEKHNTELARNYFNQALSLYEQLNNKLWIVLVEFSLGNVAFEDKDYSAAIKIYNKSLTSEHIKENPNYLGSIYNNLGNVYKDIGQYSKSFQNYEKAVSVYEFANNQEKLRGTLYNIGMLNNIIKNWSQSLPYFERSLAIARQISNTKAERQTLFEMAKAYSQLGRHKESYLSYVLFDSLDKAISGKEVQTQIAELQTQYETEKKEKEIITQKAEIQQTTLERNNLYLVLLAVVILSGAAIIFYTQRSRNLKLINRKNTELHSREVNQLMADQELKAFDAMIDGQEEERKRMAEELHDRLGSTLSATKMHFEALDSHGNKDQVDYINKLLDTAIEDTRQISHNMLSGVLTKFGLVAALHDLKETISSTGQLEVSLSTIQVDERLELDKEINLYRIVQELLSNTLKHAQANMFYIKLEKKNSTLELSVSDDGKGLGKNQDSSGIGLRNIESRVNKINGTLEIKSQPGLGTQALISVPV